MGQSHPSVRERIRVGHGWLPLRLLGAFDDSTLRLRGRGRKLRMAPEAAFHPGAGIDLRQDDRQAAFQVISIKNIVGVWDAELGSCRFVDSLYSTGTQEDSYRTKAHR